MGGKRSKFLNQFEGDERQFLFLFPFSLWFSLVVHLESTKEICSGVFVHSIEKQQVVDDDQQKRGICRIVFKQFAVQIKTAINLVSMKDVFWLNTNDRYVNESFIAEHVDFNWNLLDNDNDDDDDGDEIDRLTRCSQWLIFLTIGGVTSKDGWVAIKNACLPAPLLTIQQSGHDMMPIIVCLPFNDVT